MVNEYDKLYCVSDLHIGGRPDRQAFREVEALAWLINKAKDDPAKSVALLINGDIFDFLADPDTAQEFNRAPERLLYALTGAAYGLQPLFDALCQFVCGASRQLVLQLGNHDIELALPRAQAALEDIVLKEARKSGDFPEARVQFETSGTGWTCRVGKQVVLAVHGNASDPWNEVDHIALDRFARSGGTSSPPRTNAGTTIVIHVLNEIKKRFPFVDLFKPEDAPLMAILEAIDARQSTTGLLKAAGRLGATTSSVAELLGDEEDGAIASLDGPSNQVLEFLSQVEIPPEQPLEALRRAEQHFRDGVRPRSLVPAGDEKLGGLYNYGRVKLQRLRGGLSRQRDEPNEKSLRTALRKWL
jgi:hypothetical protein